MCTVGLTSGSSSIMPGACDGSAARDTSWHLQNEGPGAQLRRVAGHGSAVGGAGAGVPCLPTAPEEPSTGTTAPVGVARRVFGLDSTWTTPGPSYENVPGDKVARCAPVTTAISSTTITHLRNLFATHGLPEAIVTDNGSVFTSAEFNDFTEGNDTEHITSAPFHSSSNGLAEGAFRSFKLAMPRQESGTLETKLARFLFQYRITPHATTGEAPVQLLMGRQLRSLWSVMHPNLERKK